MKKLVTNALFALILMSSGRNIAQNKNYHDGSNVGDSDPLHESSLSLKPALIKGSMKTVTFGTEPRVAVKRILDNNIPLKFEGQQYYYNQGDFFKYNGGRYILISPPVGLKIKEIPKDNFRLRYNSQWLYYSNGIFFRSSGNEYQVISAPQGAIIYNLPPLTDVVVIDNEGYYEYLGILYKKLFVDNEQGFEVVGELTE